jgi:lysophospholipase L1-like esterase
MAVLSSVATILVLDVGLRISGLVTPRRGVMQPVPARHPLTDWIDVFPPEYSGTLTSKEFTVGVRAGSLGLRERDLDFAALSTEHPYLFLGDSYFFGWGVEQQQRLSGLFGTKIAEDGRPTPVVNFSFPGWGTYHYLAVWERFVPQLKPRLVIIGTFIGNDFTDDLKQSWRSFEGSGASVVPGKRPAGLFLRSKLAAREMISTSPVLTVVNHALWMSPAFRSLFSRLEIRNDRIALYETVSSDLQKQLYAATESALDSLARLSRAEGVPILVVLIPDHLQVLMPDLFRGYDFDKPQRTIQAFLDERGIPWLDLLPVFRAAPAPDELFFREDKHWNAKGHAFVAEALYQRLMGLGGPTSDRGK